VELAEVKDTIEERTARREKMRKQIAESNVASQISELDRQIRNIEAEQESINAELFSIGAVADARAELKSVTTNKAQQSTEAAKL
jgi:hypothetical protein